MEKRSFHHFTELLNLLFAATDITVSYVRLLFDLHHCDGRIDFGRQRDVNLVFIAIYTNPHTFLNIGRRDGIGKVHNKLCKLLDIDDVLGIVRICIDDFGASSNLKRQRIYRKVFK